MIGALNIKIVPVVRNFGVYIDSNLTMKNQISNTVKVCNHHLRNITFIRKYLNEDTLKMLIHNHVISRLDYCNSVYHKLPNTLLKKLQNIQNRAARLIKKIPLRERITPALIELHWLPMKARIIYKICLLTYKALKFGEPKYLYEYLVPFELETSVTGDMPAGYNFKALSCEASHLSPQFPCLSIENFLLLTYRLNK